MTTSEPAPADEYVAARSVLLDAIEAFGPHRDAVIVVGAQAVYLWTGDAGITGVAPYTTDADLAVTPRLLADSPRLDELLSSAGFTQKGDPGQWWATIDVAGRNTEIEVDVMVADRFAPRPGRRSAEMPPHGRMTARRATGLEGVMIDQDQLVVGALGGEDMRRFSVRVAGPAGLMVAKVHKIEDRIGVAANSRLDDKDAADIYRLMLAVPAAEVVRRWHGLLVDETAGPVCGHALDLLSRFFGSRGGRGIRMATAALRLAVPEDRIISVCQGFVREVRAGLEDIH